MRNIFLLVVLSSLTISCKTAYECINFTDLQWCIDDRATIVVNKDHVTIEDDRDGLPFSAIITDHSFPTKEAREVFLLSKYENSPDLKFTTPMKGQTPFVQIINEAEIQQGSHTTKIHGGIIYSKTSANSLILIEYRGVNEGKVNRYLDALLK